MEACLSDTGVRLPIKSRSIFAGGFPPTDGIPLLEGPLFFGFPLCGILFSFCFFFFGGGAFFFEFFPRQASSPKRAPESEPPQAGCCARVSGEAFATGRAISKPKRL